MIVGFLGRLGALGIAVNMIVAVLMIHLPNGFFMNWSGGKHGEGIEYHLLALALAGVIVIRGSGACSLDQLLYQKLQGVIRGGTRHGEGSTAVTPGPLRLVPRIQVMMMFIIAAAVMHAAEYSQPAKSATLPLLPPAGTVRLVQRELLTLPGYTVFDYLSCKQLEDGALVLTGQVTDPKLKKAAETAAIAVAGPAQFVNRIEVLPASARDQRLRSVLYSHLYDDDMMPYAIRKVAPIHIIVRNGQITLEGVVESGVDRLHIESAVQYVAGADGATPRVTDHLIATQDAEPLVSPLSHNDF